MGHDVSCTSCGRARPQGIHFYLSDAAPPVVDPERLREAQAGADWICAYCGSSARATVDACPNCGAARGTSPTQQVHDYDTADVPHSGKEPPAAPQPVKPAAPDGEKKGCGGCGCGCLLVLAVLLFALMGQVFSDDHGGSRPSTVTDTTAHARRGVAAVADSGYNPFIPAVAISRQWERSIAVDSSGAVVSTGSSVPADAEVIRHYRGVVGHHRVFDHDETRTRTHHERVRTGSEEYVCGQRDMGNGYFEDRMCTRGVYEDQTTEEEYKVPVYTEEDDYGTVYEYRTWEWMRDTVLARRGQSPTEPEWPRLGRHGRGQVHADSTQVYRIVFRTAQQAYTAPVTPLEYRSILVGDSVRLWVEPDTIRVLRRYRPPPRDSAAKKDTAAAAAAKNKPAAASPRHRSTSTSPARRRRHRATH